LWLKKDGGFKMARVLSYDHQPALPEQHEIKLSHEQLDRFVGAYRGPQSGRITIKREGELLVLQADKDRFFLSPQSETVFFTKERNLTFEFQRKADKVSKLVVRENGSVAEEASVEP
jgi:hypothetical protein